MCPLQETASVSHTKEVGLVNVLKYRPLDSKFTKITQCEIGYTDPVYVSDSGVDIWVDWWPNIPNLVQILGVI